MILKEDLFYSMHDFMYFI